MMSNPRPTQHHAEAARASQRRRARVLNQLTGPSSPAEDASDRRGQGLNAPPRARKKWQSTVALVEANEGDPHERGAG